MRALLSLSLLVLLGCGGVIGFKAISNPGAASGTVSSVHLAVSDTGTAITIVTLANQGTSGQFTFCGDTVNQFPMNSFVQVNFNPGAHCNQIIVVVVG